MGSTKLRLIVLGLDAADPALVLDLAARGVMGNLSRLVRDLPSIEVSSPPGLYVGALWPTFFTGSQPDQHGRYCWRQCRANAYSDEFYQIEQIKGETIWDALQDLGKKVCVIDIPKSRCGDRFRGVFVKDWGTHDPSTGGFRIDNWMSREAFVARYGRDEVGQCDRIERTAEGFRAFERSLAKRADARAQMICDLLDDDANDVILAAFSEAHCAGHQCWHIHDETHEAHDPSLREAIGDPVANVYAVLDRAIGRIFERLREDDTIAVLASHGMGAPYSGVEALNALALDFELKGAPREELDSVPNLLSGKSETFRSKLRLFPIPNNGAYAAFRLNIEGREPNGLLDEREGQAYLNAAANALLGLRETTSAAPIFTSALKTREIYDGPLVEALPDLMLKWNRERPIHSIASIGGAIVTSDGGNPRTGDHREGGRMWVKSPTECLPSSALEMADLKSWIVATATRGAVPVSPKTGHNV